MWAHSSNVSPKQRNSAYDWAGRLAFSSRYSQRMDPKHIPSKIIKCGPGGSLSRYIEPTLPYLEKRAMHQPRFTNTSESSLCSASRSSDPVARSVI
jgi:hypothetical protein